MTTTLTGKLPSSATAGEQHGASLFGEHSDYFCERNIRQPYFDPPSRRGHSAAGAQRPMPAYSISEQFHDRSIEQPPGHPVRCAANGGLPTNASAQSVQVRRQVVHDLACVVLGTVDERR